mmetsp:Transcript_20590/g.33130  ORF Transcript_20590/g.33130 Transcript_20590/m.33130 type:complete len:260 (+) Transcript_20590:46-825(+)|eukprot:CAMPEP_0178819588 /NCGR_PEP_ID=MMETSP0746-20121128/3054_1 /TAXON_ID=913974 /ORGANISM="Nitzschia punctata, Strain CCMP561" /LENGTH=259 /DNA_ID=CAMNT_0020480867 /DNA_START=24 /DNA_END=803 /DNA_ORIENTATION=+
MPAATVPSYPRTSYPKAVSDDQFYQQQLSPSSAAASTSYSSNYNSYIDSIYSMTPFVGTAEPSVGAAGRQYSPSASTVTTVGTPGNSSASSPKSNIRFDFPPELTVASSGSFSSASATSSCEEKENNRTRPSPVSSSPKSSTALVESKNKNDKKSRFRIRVPRSQNPHGSDDVHPKKKKMKKQRKQRTAAAAVGGSIVGGVVLGPAGIFLGAAVGGVAAKQICKVGERRAQRRYEQESFQSTAFSKSNKWSQEGGASFA